MEKKKKNSAQSTYTTLKECLENPAWQKAREIIERDTKYRLNNHFYDDQNEERN